MSFQISDVAYGLIDRYMMARRDGILRRADRKLCRSHPEWVPLTSGELAAIDRRDRWGYMFYKNMYGAENLSRFITAAPYATRLLPALNPVCHWTNAKGFNTEFSDKNYAPLFMSGMTFPRTIFSRSAGLFFGPDRQPITPEEALALLAPYEEAVFKQTIGTAHGHGIRLVPAAEFASALREHGPDYVAQERIRQHPDLAYFNPSSVNIVRVTTLLWKEHVYVLGGILRVGAPGAFCDHENKDGKTYLSIPVAEDGTILPRACDVDYGHVYPDCHGTPIRGKFPHYEEIKDLVRREHIRHPHYALIGWDITVDAEDRVLCIEFNTKYPGLTGTQAALGPVLARPSVDGRPLFDELMESLT